MVDKEVRMLCERGFSLIELMIAIVISSVIVAGGYTILTATHKATISNERAVGTQQNIRVAMEVIARDIKLSGFGMPASPNPPVGGLPAIARRAEQPRRSGRSIITPLFR